MTSYINMLTRAGISAATGLGITTMYAMLGATKLGLVLGYMCSAIMMIIIWDEREQNEKRKNKPTKKNTRKRNTKRSKNSRKK